MEFLTSFFKFYFIISGLKSIVYILFIIFITICWIGVQFSDISLLKLNDLKYNLIADKIFAYSRKWVFT